MERWSMVLLGIFIVNEFIRSVRLIGFSEKDPTTEGGKIGFGSGLGSYTKEMQPLRNNSIFIAY